MTPPDRQGPAAPRAPRPRGTDGARSRAGRAWVVALLGTVALSTAVAQTQFLDRARAPRPDLTAFRPRNLGGYAPFARTSVPDALEEDAQLGPGIRRAGATDDDPVAEDDLIELVVDRGGLADAIVLERTAPHLKLWTTHDRQPGTEVPFVGDRTAPLAFGGGAATYWVEWVGTTGALGALELRANSGGKLLDRVVLHAFDGLVVALGGEGQVPGLPVDPNHGTFVVATELYERGYDVLMRDEDEVDGTGAGPVYDQVVTALTDRGVHELAVFGFSHGGGSTADLLARLDAASAGLPAYTVGFTSYTDGVGNASDIDVSQESTRPADSGFHANHYQHGTLFEDFFLDGTAIANSEPPPAGLDVETTPWGANATHYDVDDYVQVTSFLLSNLEPRVGR